MAESGRRIRIGYALADKKRNSFIRPSLVELARERGIDLVAIDESRTLDEHGPFDCILHKRYGESWKTQLRLYEMRNPGVVIIDHPEAIARLHNRISMLQVVSELESPLDKETFGIPKQIVIYDSVSLSDAATFSALRFPVIAKPLVADGSAKSHKMALVYHPAGLAKQKPPVVLQEFINHGGVIFKVYVVGDYVKCVKRKSLPDVTQEKLESSEASVSFSQVSNLNSVEDTEVRKYYEKMNLDETEMPPRDFLTQIARGLRQATKLHLFNFDMIKDTTNVGNRYLVRKYTGLTKFNIIENLLRIVSGKKKPGKSAEDAVDAAQPPPASPPPPAKRQRKNAHPRRLPLEGSRSMERIAGESVEASKLCKNAACRASMSPEEPFCRRCSCYICHKFDENKDPSLWLVCGSEPPSEGDSCGASYHLECVLKREKGGVAGTDRGEGLDGSFYCVHCGKVNDLLGCLRKQLATARNARRVDTLCCRVSLSRRILDGNQRLRDLHDVVDSAASKLEAEVGTLDGLPAKMGRGIVNRLSCGAEVQTLCAAAIATVDSMLSSSSPSPTNQELGPLSISVDFEDVSPTSLTVVVRLREEAPPLPAAAAGYSVWCRKVEASEYPAEPVGKLAEPERRFPVSGLEPATGYVFKVVGLAITGEFGKREFWFTTPGSRKDPAIEVEGDSSKKKSQSPSEDCGESFNTLPESSSGSLQKKKPEIPDLEEEASVHGGDGADAEQEIPGSAVLGGSQWDSSNSTELDLNQALEPPRSEEESNEPAPPGGQGATAPPYGCSEAIILPFTPSKLETAVKAGGGGEDAWFAEQGKEPCPGSSSKKKKRSAPPPREGGALAADYEYCVKTIRRLECEGHIETSFRVKFLTWFSLRASPQERRVVSVFVDAMADDPPSLAGQLVDTFSEGIRRKPPPPLPIGFCTKLWH